MILNVRGTGGAGKSTLVREVMARYPSMDAVYAFGRRRPVGYHCARPVGRSLFVVGHYETPCGGADTLPSPDAAYDLIERTAPLADVMFEGIITQDDVRRCVALAQHHEVLVLALDVPIDLCLASIQDRRRKRNDGRPLNPKNTMERAQRLTGTIRRLAEAGVPTLWVSREVALQTCLDHLQLSSTRFDREFALR